MPRAFGESIALILRLYDRDDAGQRDPFDHVIFVKGDLGVAHLSGMRDTKMRDFLNPAWRREIARELRAHGFHTAIWYRVRNGATRKFTIDLATL